MPKDTNSGDFLSYFTPLCARHQRPRTY
jgi:hypothetical protein